MNAPFSQAQVLILSSIDWDASWQRHQVFAWQWAAQGHRVFFVENTGLRGLRPNDWARVIRKLGRLFRPGGPAASGRGLPGGLTVINPLVLPPSNSLFRFLNDFLFVPRLAGRLQAAGLKPDCLAVVYPPSATSLSLLKRVGPAVTVYDCVDNVAGLPGRPKDLAVTEAALLARSDVVLATSATLYERRAAEHANVLELHHGVSPRFFIETDPSAVEVDACYFGTLWQALDYSAISALAGAGFSVRLIGPVKERLPRLPKTVELRRPVSYESLPAELSRCRALLLPYADTEYNKGVIPAKIYECLATGLPVLASPLPSLKKLEAALYICRRPEDWAQALRRLPETETPQRRAQRVALAREHEHAATFRRLTTHLAQTWQRKPAPPPATREDTVFALARGLTWIAALYGLARVATLLVQVVAGRWLGPLHYGRANLVIAAAAYLQILPMLGFPLAMSRFVSDEQSPRERAAVISTILITFFAWAGAWLALLWALSGLLAEHLHASQDLVRLAIAFAFLTALHIVLASPLLGLKRFGQRGVSEAVYGLSAVFFLLVFIVQGPRTHVSFIWALCLSLLAASAFSLWRLRQHLRPLFEPRIFARFYGYAALATVNLLALACIVAPARLILHRWVSASSVGVFSAYFTTTSQISLALIYMLTSVVVPVTHTARGQSETWRRFLRAAPALTAAAMLGFCGTAAAGLSLFGRQYPFVASWVALFAAAATLMLLHGVASALFAARDLKGLAVSAAGNFLAGAGNAALAFWLIPKLGIRGAALALIGGYLAGLAVYAAAAPWRDRFVRLGR